MQLHGTQRTGTKEVLHRATLPLAMWPAWLPRGNDHKHELCQQASKCNGHEPVHP